MCAADNETAKKTHRLMLQDAFLAAIDDAMSTKIKSDTKHRDLEITKLTEEFDRLELVYKKSSPEVNSMSETDRSDESTFRQIIRDEIAAAVAKGSHKVQADGEVDKKVNFVGRKRFPFKRRYPSRGKRSEQGQGRRYFQCQSSAHFKKDCPFNSLCERCWEEGHTARSCKALFPRPTPSLNSKAAVFGKPSN